MTTIFVVMQEQTPEMAFTTAADAKDYLAARRLRQGKAAELLRIETVELTGLPTPGGGTASEVARKGRL